MLRRLMYILLTLFLAVNLSAQNPYVIDSVCVGSVRNYGIDGEKGSSFEWFILDTLGNTLFSPYDTTFVKPGDTINVSEITHTWNVVGVFDIRVLHYSGFGCDTLEQGRVRVYEAPYAEAGPDQTLCSAEAIFMMGDTAMHYSALHWETLGDGTFDNPNILHPEYFKGIADSIAGSVTLVLMAEGLAGNGTCETAVDSVVIIFSDPKITLNVYPILCYNDSTGSIKLNVTGANLPYTLAWTGPGGFTASADSLSDLGAGMYRVLLTDANGCIATDSVEITQPAELIAVIDSVKHVTCYGGSDGVAIVNVTGGVYPYAYSWSGIVDNDSIAGGLPAGKYFVTVTDANSCIAIDSVEITQPDELIVLNDSVRNVTCYNGTDGAAWVFLTGGTGIYTYEWNTTPVQDSAVAVNLAAGEYIVKVTDENGCTVSDTVTITEPLPLALSADSIDARCGGKIPGSIDLTVSGGTPFVNAPHYLYEWHDSTGVIATTEDIFNLAGDRLYWVYVTDSLGCIDSLEMYVNEEKNILIQLEAIDSVLCFNDSTGNIDITVSRGKKPYSYKWYRNNILIDSLNEDLVGIPAGSYRVVVNDANGCDEELSFILNNPDELLAAIAGDSVICENESTTLNGNPTGGTGNYTHLWSGSGAVYLSQTNTVSPVFAGAAPGDYNLLYTVTDENGCVAKDSVLIKVNRTYLLSVDTSICAGLPDFDWNGQTVTSVADASYTVTLQTAAGCDSTVTLNVTVIPPVTASVDTMICAGLPDFDWNGQTVTSVADATYTVMLQTAAGCDSTVTLNVTILPVPVTILDTMICAGLPDFDWNGQTVTSVADASYTVTLQTAAGCDSTVTLNVTILPVPVTILDTTICAGLPDFDWNGQTVTSVADATYTVTLQTTAGCDSTVTLNVTVIPPVTASVDTMICAGLPDFDWNGQTVTSVADASYTVTLQTAAGCDSTVTLNVTILPVPVTILDTTICAGLPDFVWNGQTVTSVADASYTVTLQTAAGCDSTVTLNVTVIPPVTASVDTMICAGLPDFDWNGQTVTSVADASYTVTLQTAVGCDSTVTLNVTILPVPVTILDTTICAGLPDFDWNGQTVTSVADASYTVTLQTAAGCDSTVTLNVTVIPPVTASVDTMICAGLPDFDWNGQTVTSVADASYTVTLQTAEGCDSTVTLNVTILPVPVTILDTMICAGLPDFDWNGQTVTSVADASYTVTLQTTAGCDSTVTLNVTVIPPVTASVDTMICAGLPNFDWNGQTVTSVADASYTVTLQTAEGCDSTVTLNVTILPVPVTILDTTICAGLPDFDWNGQTVTSVADASYTVTLQTAAGCDSTVTLNVTVIPPVTASVDTMICAGLPDFDWNGQTVTSVADASYTVTLQTTAGCDSTVTLNVTITPAITALVDTTLCEGSPSFVWNGQTIDTNTSGTYAATLTSAAGCDSTVTLNVTVIPPVTASVDTMICAGLPDFVWNGQTVTSVADASYTVTLQTATGCDSTVTLNVTITPAITALVDTTLCEGSPSFVWNGQTIDTNTSGTYAATLTSAAGCDSIVTLNVNVTPALEVSVTIDASATVVNAGESVIFTATPVNGGTLPVYAWYVNGVLRPGETSVTFTYVPQDGDEVFAVLTSNLTCVTNNPDASNIITITVNPPLPTDLDLDALVVNIDCYGHSTGSIDLTVSGGSGNYSFEWSNGEVLEDLISLPAGSYSVKIIDNDFPNLEKDTVILVSQPPKLVVALEGKGDVLEDPDPIGWIKISVSGGTPGYTYNWTGPNGWTSKLEDPAGLEAGSYSVMVSDANGCDTILSVVINGYGINCPPTVYVQCPEDVPAEFKTYAQFEAAGGNAYSNLYQLVENTFVMESEVSDNKKCPETITRTYSIANTNGDVVSCTQLIIVHDTEAPTLTFRVRDAQCGVTIPRYTTLTELENSGRATFDDNCGKYKLTLELVKDEIIGTCPEIIKRTYRLTDECGNSIEKEEVSRIYDIKAPEVTRGIRDIDAKGCTPPAPMRVYRDFVEAGGLVYDCSDFTMKFVKDSVAIAGVLIYRTYQFTDICDNSVKYVQKINLSPLDPTFDPIGPLCQFSAAPVLPTVSKEGITGTWSPSSVNTAVVGPRTYTFTPRNGQCSNTTTLTIEVTPAVLLAETHTDPIGGVNNGKISLVVSGGTPAFTFAWSGPNGFVSTQQNISNLAEGTYTVIVTDQNNCQASEEVTLVAKASLIVLNCPPPDTVSCPEDLPAEFKTFEEFVVAGGSALTDEFSTVDTASFRFEGQTTDSKSCPETITRTYSIRNSKGEKAECEHITIIWDLINPVLVFNVDTVECGNGPFYYDNIQQLFMSNRAAFDDNCGWQKLSIELLAEDSLGICPLRIAREYKITDECGNSVSAVEITFVKDTRHPAIFSGIPDFDNGGCELPDILENYEQFRELGGFVVDCSSFTMTWGGDSTDASGVVHRTYIFTDICGNDTTHIQKLNLTNKRPIFDLIAILCPNSVPPALQKVSLNGITGTWSPDTIRTDTLGKFTFRFTADTGQCALDTTLTVYVGDTIPPDAVCRNITVSLDENGTASIVTAQINNGSTDNCAIDTMYLDRYDFDCVDIGVNQVWLTVIDENGLIDSCMATVTVVDDVKPTVECKQNIPEIQLDENAQYQVDVSMVMVEGSFSDACFEMDTTYVYPYELTCENIGLTTFTLYAVAENGDTAFCQTTVNIYGNRAPNVLPDTATTYEDVAVDIDVLLNDYDDETKSNVPKDSLRILIKPQKGTVEINPKTGIVTYTPFPGKNGFDVFRYKVCDNGIPCDPECGEAFVYITIIAVNDPPLAENDTLTVECLSESMDILLNDFDPDDNIYVNTVPLVPPAHGVATIDASGVLSYSPNVGFIGVDSLQYEVYDDGEPVLRDTAWVYFNVDCSEENPNPVECELFVPEGFSPNSDGIHDFFRVMCIHLYPDATMRIFNRNGNLLWMKKNYGNYDVWGDAQNAWWWGNTDYRWDQGTRSVPNQPGKIVKVGNYVWVLDLGNGEIRNGTVMVQY